jgi:hypothetical protein
VAGGEAELFEQCGFVAGKVFDGSKVKADFAVGRQLT